MRIQQLSTLQSFLQSTKLTARFFLVVIADDYDRKYWINEIIRFLPVQDNFSMQRFNLSHSLDEILSSINSLSLFAKQQLVIVDELDARKKQDTETLLQNIQKNSGQDSYYIFAAQYVKTLSSWASFASTTGVFIDGNGEKNWEKEKRVAQWVEDICQKENKKIPPSALSLLLQKVGITVGLLEQEIKKVLAFVGEKDLITEEDIQKVCINSQQYTFWQISDKIVWKGDFSFSLPHMESSFFYGFIVAIRSQLQQGLKMVSLLQKKITPQEFASYFPKVFPKQLEQRKNRAIALGEKWFQKALVLLYDMELASKNNIRDFSLLSDIFCSKLKSLKIRKL